MPASMIACLFGLSVQLSFDSSNAPEPSCNSRTGSARGPGTGSDGPRAMTATVFSWLPVIMKPAKRALSPVSTGRRVETLASVVGVTVGVAVGVATGVPVGVAVGVAVGVGFGAIAVVNDCCAPCVVPAELVALALK